MTERDKAERYETEIIPYHIPSNPLAREDRIREIKKDMSPTDLEALEQLALKVHPTTLYRNPTVDYTFAVYPGDLVVFLARSREDNRLVGMLEFIPAGHYGMVHWIKVLREYRGKHIGTALMLALIDYVGEGSRMHLDALRSFISEEAGKPSSRNAARALFQHRGFERSPHGAFVLNLKKPGST